MKQEDKLLLLKDLSARLPYGVICRFEDTIRITDGNPDPYYEYKLSERHIGFFRNNKDFYIKPYLRQMSSMTEEERDWYYNFIDRKFYYESASELVDWLNSHNFDYRGLIPKGLAIEVTKDNNPYKN